MYLTVFLLTAYAKKGPVLAAHFLCSVCCTSAASEWCPTIQHERNQPTFHGFRCLDELSHSAGDSLRESSQLVFEFRGWFLENLRVKNKTNA